MCFSMLVIWKYDMSALLKAQQNIIKMHLIYWLLKNIKMYFKVKLT